MSILCFGSGSGMEKSDPQHWSIMVFLLLENPINKILIPCAMWPHKSCTIHISTKGMVKKKTLNNKKFDGEAMFLSFRATQTIDSCLPGISTKESSFWIEVKLRNDIQRKVSDFFILFQNALFFLLLWKSTSSSSKHEIINIYLFFLSGGYF